MNEEVFKGYLTDTIVLIKEQVREAKLDADQPEKGFEDYNKGQIMGYHTVISLLKDQASALNIEEKEIGLDDIDPDTDLLSTPSPIP